MADTLSQVIVPELFNPYVINRTKEKSAFKYGTQLAKKN